MSKPKHFGTFEVTLLRTNRKVQNDIYVLNFYALSVTVAWKILRTPFNEIVRC